MESLKVLILSDWGDNPYKKLLMSHLNILNVQVEEEFLSNLSLPFFLPAILKRGKIDILHFQTLHPFLIARNTFFRLIKAFILVIQLFIISILGTKVIWTVHEWDDKEGNGNKKIFPIQSVIVGRFIHGFITHCETTKNNIVKAFKLENKEKVFIVPHGNYIGTYENTVNQSEARKTLGIPEENVVFLLFGGIYRYKGVLEAIQAFKQLPQSGVSLLIAGKPYETELREKIFEEIKGYENILFTPEVIPDEKVQIYMNACDSVLVPYKVFTTSGIAILAMSYGKACIAPNIGFFSDVLNDLGAFLYDPNSEYVLLETMKQVIENKDELSNMGLYNLRIAERWNWKLIAEKNHYIYQFSLKNNFKKIRQHSLLEE
jgi:beta-1,4-mannosyltransferase